jgi:hypothetical protein
LPVRVWLTADFIFPLFFSFLSRYSNSIDELGYIVLMLGQL